MTNSANRKQHTNDERTVVCPVENCNEEPLARGVHLHVRRSKGDGHGPQGEVPEGIDFDDLETVGAREVSMDYPESRETEEAGLLCPYCNNPFRGLQGLNIHLSRTAGTKNHPEDYPEFNPGDLPRVELDENENIVEVIEGGDLPPVDGVERVSANRLISQLENEGKKEAAEEIRNIISD